MCVICYKERGKKLPSEETMRAMWRSNPDGAGVMWKNADGLVDFRKGFMKLDDFLDFVKQNHDLLEGTECALHFRIGTHGGNTPGNTHPFVVKRDADPHALTGKGESYVLMHNGILSVRPRADDISDTAELALRAGRFDRPDWFLDAVPELIGDGNRIVLFRRDGDALFFGGKWQRGSDGLMYSNLNHVPLADMWFCGDAPWWGATKKRKSKTRNGVGKRRSSEKMFDVEDVPLPSYLDVGMGPDAEEVARDSIYYCARTYVGETSMTEEEWACFFDTYRADLEEMFWSDPDIENRIEATPSF